MDKAGDLFGKFTRQIQNGVCLDFALPAPKAKKRMLRGGEARALQAEVARQKSAYVKYFCGRRLRGVSRTSGRRCGAVLSAAWSLRCAAYCYCYY